MLKYEPSVTFIDANARVGSIVSEYIGDMGWAEEENHNGQRLHELALTCHTYAVNTLIPHNEGYTWVMKKGGPYHRIDYILVNKQMSNVPRIATRRGTTTTFTTSTIITRWWRRSKVK